MRPCRSQRAAAALGDYRAPNGLAGACRGNHAVHTRPGSLERLVLAVEAVANVELSFAPHPGSLERLVRHSPESGQGVANRLACTEQLVRDRDRPSREESEQRLVERRSGQERLSFRRRRRQPPGRVPRRPWPPRGASVLDGRLDEAVEQRVRPIRTRLLNSGWNWLATNHGMVAQLDDLDQPPVGRLAGQHHAALLERLAVVVADLEAVAVALVDDLVAVGLGGLRAGRQPRRVEAQAHRAALVLHLALVGHEVDHRRAGEQVELGRVGVALRRRRRARTRSRRTAGRGTARGRAPCCSRA